MDKQIDRWINSGFKDIHWDNRSNISNHIDLSEQKWDNIVDIADMYIICIYIHIYF